MVLKALRRRVRKATSRGCGAKSKSGGAEQRAASDSVELISSTTQINDMAAGAPQRQHKRSFSEEQKEQDEEEEEEEEEEIDEEAEQENFPILAFDLLNNVVRSDDEGFGASSTTDSTTDGEITSQYDSGTSHHRTTSRRRRRRGGTRRSNKGRRKKPSSSSYDSSEESSSSVSSTTSKEDEDEDEEEELPQVMGRRVFEIYSNDIRSIWSPAPSAAEEQQESDMIISKTEDVSTTSLHPVSTTVEGVSFSERGESTCKEDESTHTTIMEEVRQTNQFIAKELWAMMGWGGSSPDRPSSADARAGALEQHHVFLSSSCSEENEEDIISLGCTTTDDVEPQTTKRVFHQRVGHEDGHSYIFKEDVLIDPNNKPETTSEMKNNNNNNNNNNSISRSRRSPSLLMETMSLSYSQHQHYGIPAASSKTQFAPIRSMMSTTDWAQQPENRATTPQPFMHWWCQQQLCVVVPDDFKSSFDEVIALQDDENKATVVVSKFEVATSDSQATETSEEGGGIPKPRAMRESARDRSVERSTKASGAPEATTPLSVNTSANMRKTSSISTSIESPSKRGAFNPHTSPRNSALTTMDKKSPSRSHNTDKKSQSEDGWITTIAEKQSLDYNYTSDTEDKDASDDDDDDDLSEASEVLSIDGFDATHGGDDDDDKNDHRRHHDEHCSTSDVSSVFGMLEGVDSSSTTAGSPLILSAEGCLMPKHRNNIIVSPSLCTIRHRATSRSSRVLETVVEKKEQVEQGGGGGGSDYYDDDENAYDSEPEPCISNLDEDDDDDDEKSLIDYDFFEHHHVDHHSSSFMLLDNSKNIMNSKNKKNKKKRVTFVLPPTSNIGAF